MVPSKFSAEKVRPHHSVTPGNFAHPAVAEWFRADRRYKASRDSTIPPSACPFTFEEWTRPSSCILFDTRLTNGKTAQLLS